MLHNNDPLSQQTSINKDDLVSSWDKNDSDEENELFDQEIADIILLNKKRETIFDVGQKEIELDLD